MDSNHPYLVQLKTSNLLKNITCVGTYRCSMLSQHVTCDHEKGDLFFLNFWAHTGICISRNQGKEIPGEDFVVGNEGEQTGTVEFPKEDIHGSRPSTHDLTYSKL